MTKYLRFFRVAEDFSPLGCEHLLHSHSVRKVYNLRPTFLIFHSKNKITLIRIKKYQVWAFKLRKRKFRWRPKERRKWHLEVEMLLVQSSCLAGIPKIAGMCPWIHGEERPYSPDGSRQGNLQGGREASFSAGSSLAPSLTFLLTEVDTWLLLSYLCFIASYSEILPLCSFSIIMGTLTIWLSQLPTISTQPPCPSLGWLCSWLWLPLPALLACSSTPTSCGTPQNHPDW